MINLMYLVLTALLALNVSAEVMNAFFDIDKSLVKSNKLTSAGVESTKQGIQGVLDKKPKIKTQINTGIDAVRTDVDAIVKYIEDVKDQLIDQSGNKDGSNNEGDYDKFGKPKGKKNKDVTTKMLVLDGMGDNIEAQVNDISEKLLAHYTAVITDKDIIGEAKLKEDEVQQKIDDIKNGITLKTDNSWKEKSKDKTSWADYKFRQMPVAAVLPVLTKIQADARNSEATIVNKLAELVGGREIKLNKFFPVMNAKKGYVIKGEKFEAEVAIGAYSSDFAGSSTITVNGQKINLNAEGKGTYTATANSYGKQTLNLKAVVKNPITGEIMDGTSSFSYEVGERSATVSADKMNVFYIGVKNPISVAVAGASSNEVKVSATGATASGSNGKYVITATRPGEASINVTAPGIKKSFPFRIKRIPDPVPTLGGGPSKNGGAMGNGEFKAQLGLAAVLVGFDFDAKCKIQGYEVTKVAKRQDPVTSNNAGARYNDKSKRLVTSAKPGDTYYFDNVKAKCPGDPAGRKLPSIVFKIK